MAVSYLKVVSPKPGEGVTTKRSSDISPGDVRICDLPFGQSPQYRSYTILPPNIATAQTSGDIAIPTLATVMPKLYGQGLKTFIRPLDRKLRFADKGGPSPEEVELLIPKPGSTQTQCINLIATTLSQKPASSPSPSGGGVRPVFQTAGNSASGRTGSVPISDDDAVTGYRPTTGSKFDL